MIMFDYGHTLLSCAEKDNGLRGTEALMKHIADNPRGLSAREVDEYVNNVYLDVICPLKDSHFEMHEYQFHKLVYEPLGLTFNIDDAEMERVYWDNAAPDVKMPNVERMLAYLRERGIRSGLISNIMFSGAGLAGRINRDLPDNDFEFIIASSEYGVRKPHKSLFLAALAKAKLNPEDVWFCGDNVINDVGGANAAGIFPVWYVCDAIPDPYYDERNVNPPTCEHLRVTDWVEMIGVLSKLE